MKGVTGTATVTVIIGNATTLTITPDTGRIAVGGTQQFTAVATDAGGNVVSSTSLWSVGVGGGALTSTGLLTASTVADTFANLVTATSGTQWQGTIMALTSITFVDHATLFGRALARNGSVTLGANNSWGLGVRLGAFLSPRVSLEFEGGATRGGRDKDASSINLGVLSA